jgi:hypothetical protein
MRLFSARVGINPYAELRHLPGALSANRETCEPANPTGLSLAKRIGATG